MAELLTPAEKHSLEVARDLAARGQAVGCLEAIVLVNCIDGLVHHLQHAIRGQGRRDG